MSKICVKVYTHFSISTIFTIELGEQNLHDSMSTVKINENKY